jgi:cytochrome c556
VRHIKPTPFTASVATAGVMLVLAIASPGAQRRNNGAGNQGVPVATAVLLEHPEVYDGKTITLSAGVERVLSKTAFVVDQRKAISATGIAATGKPVLVIAPEMQVVAPEKQYVLISGQVVRFDPTVIARVAPTYKLDVAPEVWAQFEGQPIVIAVSVVNSVSVELAKRPVPPMTAAETSMSTAMKTINPAFGALRSAAQKSQGTAVLESATALVPAFTQAEAIWDNLGVTAAAELARQARAYATTIDRAAAAGNWDAVTTAFGSLNQTCQECHRAYRERLDDGSFRFKAGMF